MRKLKRFSRFLCLFFILICLFTGCQRDTGKEVQDSVNHSMEHIVENDAADTSHQTENEIQEETEFQTEVEIDAESSTDISNAESDETVLDENGSYTSKEDVAAYLHTYGKLPKNFITKKEAKKLGWVSQEGNLDEVAPGMSIGGDYFGNYEGSLPEKDDRDYYECDINFDGGHRGAERIVYSNDGLIYYTGDHYETFELLYGEE